MKIPTLLLLVLFVFFYNTTKCQFSTSIFPYFENRIFFYDSCCQSDCIEFKGETVKVNGGSLNSNIDILILVQYTDSFTVNNDYVLAYDTIVLSKNTLDLSEQTIFSYRICDLKEGVYDYSYIFRDRRNNNIVSLGGVMAGPIKVKKCIPISAFGMGEDKVCIGKSVVFKDSSFRSPSEWYWRFDGGEPDFYEGKNPPSIQYNKAGIYDVSLHTSNEVGDNEKVFSKKIEVTKCKDCIYVPSAFSPNRDDINDNFEVFTNCPIKDFKLSIYNRWGEKVFFSNDINQKWNGNYKGQFINSQIFTFFMQITYSNGVSDSKKGSITLIK